MLLQSASLPGSAGPDTGVRRGVLRAALSRRWAAAIACFAILSPSSECWLSHSAMPPRTASATKPAQSRDASDSFICPENCGSASFTESTKFTPSQTSGGEIFTSRGNSL